MPEPKRRTDNLDLPLIPQEDYETKLVADMVDDIMGDKDTSAFNILDEAVGNTQTAITNIQSIIPAEATANNKLADKAFVANRDPHFKGIFNNESDLLATSATVNDYAIYKHESEESGKEGIICYDYYVYESDWVYKYTIESSSATGSGGQAIVDYEEELPEITTENKDSLARLDGDEVYAAEYHGSVTPGVEVLADTSKKGGSPYTVPNAQLCIDANYVTITAITNGFNYTAFPNNKPFKIGKAKGLGSIVFNVNTSSSFKVYIRDFITSPSAQAGVGAKVLVNGIPYTLDPTIDDTGLPERLEVSFAAGTTSITLAGVEPEGASTSDNRRCFLFEGISIDGEDTHVAEWHQLARVDYVDEQIATVEDKVIAVEDKVTAVEETVADHAEQLDGLTGRVFTIETEMGTVQVFDAEYLPVAGKNYLNKILRVDHKLYQCINQGDEDAFIKHYSFENLTGTSEIFDYNWVDVARVVTDDFKNYFTAVDYEHVVTGEDDLIEGAKYRVSVEDNPTDGEIIFLDDTSTIVSIDSYTGEPQGDYNLPINNIDCISWEPWHQYQVTLGPSDNESAHDHREWAINRIVYICKVSQEVAETDVDTSLSGNEVIIDCLEHGWSPSSMQSFINTFIENGFDASYTDNPSMLIHCDDISNENRYNFQGNDASITFTIDTLADDYSSDINLTKINYDWESNKIFRNNGEIKFGNSTTEGKLSIYRIDESPLPITKIKAIVKSWNTSKPSALSLDINNGAYAREEVLVEPSEERQTIEFEDFNTDTVKGVKFDLSSCLFAYVDEHQDKEFERIQARVQQWVPPKPGGNGWKDIGNCYLYRAPEYDSWVPDKAFLLYNNWFNNENISSVFNVPDNRTPDMLIEDYDSDGQQISHGYRAYFIENGTSVKRPSPKTMFTEDGREWILQSQQSNTGEDKVSFWYEYHEDPEYNWESLDGSCSIEDFDIGYIIPSVFYQNSSHDNDHKEGYNKAITGLTWEQDVHQEWTDPRLRLLELVVYYGNIQYQWVEVSGGAKVEIVDELPDVGEENTIYLIETEDHSKSGVDFEEVDELPEVGDPGVIYLMDPEDDVTSTEGKVKIKVTKTVPTEVEENMLVLTPVEESGWEESGQEESGISTEYNLTIGKNGKWRKINTSSNNEEATRFTLTEMQYLFNVIAISPELLPNFYQPLHKYYCYADAEAFRIFWEEMGAESVEKYIELVDNGLFMTVNYSCVTKLEEKVMGTKDRDFTVNVEVDPVTSDSQVVVGDAPNCIYMEVILFPMLWEQ